MHLKIQGRDCLLKALTTPYPWKRPGRQFRLQKEMFIYNRLKNINFYSFHYPKVSHTDGKSYIITDYIPNDPSLGRNDSLFYTQAIKSIQDFNTCDFHIKAFNCAGWAWERVNRWKFSRSAKTLRNLMEGAFIKGMVPISSFLKLFSFWAKAMFATKKLKSPLLVHRDIFKANILRPEPDKIYFVDFEKAGIEKRWVFVDALKIAQAEPMFFKRKGDEVNGFPRFYKCLIQQYWENLQTRRPEISADYQHFKLQLKFCLMGWTLKKLVKENPGDELAKNLVRFMETVIAEDDQYFDRWYSELPRLNNPDSCSGIAPAECLETGYQRKHS